MISLGTIGNFEIYITSSNLNRKQEVIYSYLRLSLPISCIDAHALTIALYLGLIWNYLYVASLAISSSFVNLLTLSFQNASGKEKKNLTSLS